MLTFRNLPVPKKLRIRRGEYPDFPLKFFLCNSSENFQSGLFLCFREILASKKKYTDESGEKEGVSRCPVEIFCSTVLEFFVGEHLGASLFSRTKKYYS